jgi:hypothetical protein
MLCHVSLVTNLNFNAVPFSGLQYSSGQEVCFMFSLHASVVAQGNVVRAMSASYGKAYIRPFAETKPLNLQPQKLA